MVTLLKDLYALTAAYIGGYRAGDFFRHNAGDCAVKSTIVDDDGTQITCKNGMPHSFRDKPAKIFTHGLQEWYRDGVRHRDSGPAAIWGIGTQEWFRNGVHHRDDGPAVVFPNGDKSWFRNGKRHRDGDAPAVVWGTIDHKEWFQDGVPHRDNGPAVILSDGTQEFYRHGVLYHRLEKNE